MLHPTRTALRRDPSFVAYSSEESGPTAEPPEASGAAWRGAPLPGRCPRHAPPHDPQAVPASAVALLHPKPHRVGRHLQDWAIQLSDQPTHWPSPDASRLAARFRSVRSYTLPNGRILEAGPTPDSKDWHLRIVGEPNREIVGRPLRSALAELLGYAVAHESWPSWIDRQADEIEAAFRGHS
jgi:hypothetical protein